MNASANRNTGELTTGNREISKFKEDITMKLSMIITKNTPAKVLGGLAVGALLLAATALPQGTVHAADSAAPVILSEEWYHPITGEINVGLAELGNLGEEFYHPTTGKLNVGPAASISVG